MLNEVSPKNHLSGQPNSSLSDGEQLHAAEWHAAPYSDPIIRSLRTPPRPAFCSLDEMIERHCPDLWRSFLGGRSIRFEVASEPIAMEPRRAWQSCLVLSELVRTMLRHRFCVRENGSVTIELRQLSGHVVCFLACVGGAAGRTRSDASADLASLVFELSGTIHRADTPNGETFLLTFPLSDPHASTVEH